jgi:hypothetical protein
LHCFAFVTLQVVEDDDVAGSQGWDQRLLNPGQEIFGIDRLIKNVGRGNLVAAQGRDECHGFPVPIGDLGGQPLAVRTPAAQRRHVCFGPSLVYKNQTAWINTALIFAPEPPPAGHVRPILLGGQNTFF